MINKNIKRSIAVWLCFIIILCNAIWMVKPQSSILIEANISEKGTNEKLKTFGKEDKIASVTSRSGVKREPKVNNDTEKKNTIVEYTLYELNINNESFLYFETLDKAEIQKDYLLRNTENLTVNTKEIIEYNKDKLSAEYTINNTVENYILKYKKKVKCFPTISHKVTSVYGKRPSRGDFHCGIDLAGRYGDSIFSYKSGKIIKVQYSNVSYGNMVLIQHNDGSQSRYAHMSSINVKNGQYVNCGDKIGEMGSTGNSTGVHLHFEIIINGKTVNPYSYIF